jgi:hypothetical protein
MAATNVIPIKPRAAKAKPFVPPKQLAQCADLLYTTRQDRLALEKEVEALKARETTLREHLIENLPKSQASGVSGRVANAKIETKEIPQVKDWDLFYKHVKRTGDFELMQRRLSDAAVKERWEAGKKVPGVEVFTATVVSCTKV